MFCRRFPEEARTTIDNGLRQVESLTTELRPGHMPTGNLHRRLHGRGAYNVSPWAVLTEGRLAPGFHSMIPLNAPATTSREPHKLVPSYIFSIAKYGYLRLFETLLANFRYTSCQCAFLRDQEFNNLKELACLVDAMPRNTKLKKGQCSYRQHLLRSAHSRAFGGPDHDLG